MPYMEGKSALHHGSHEAFRHNKLTCHTMTWPPKVRLELLVWVINGTTPDMRDTPDTPGHRAPAGRAGQPVRRGYPQIRLAALVACGTRAITNGSRRRRGACLPMPPGYPGAANL